MRQSLVMIGQATSAKKGDLHDSCKTEWPEAMLAGGHNQIIA